jgi:cellulase/cellobiase CelA1/cytochrome c553
MKVERKNRFFIKALLFVCSFQAINASDNTTFTQTRTSDWNSGFCENVEVKNITSSKITWKAEFVVDGIINNLWSANYTQNQETGTVVAEGVSWNRELWGYGSTSFGYCADKVEKKTPTSTPPNSNDLIVSKTKTDSWNNGFCETFKIKNNGSQEIEWDISTDVDGKIYDLWNANYSQGDDLVLKATGVSWNKIVRANSSVEFGYCANKIEVTPPNTDKKDVQKDRRNLTFETIRQDNKVENNITTGLNLIAQGVKGSTITWKSSRPSVISTTGVVTRPKSNKKDKKVTLTATLTKGNYSKNKRFKLTVTKKDTTVEPPVTSESKYHDVLKLSLKFYEAQRAIGPFPTVTWRQPATTNDGSDVGVDLNGGWFDAGDHVKFNQPMSYTATMLNWSLIKDKDVYQQAGKLEYGKSQVKYALDYLLKTYNAGADLNSASDDKVYYQVEDGNADHSAGWIAPHQITKNRPTFTCDKNSKCSAISAQMSASFASGAILFADDLAYATTLLNSAKRIFKFAESYQGDAGSNAKASPFYTSGGFKDELGLASIWLYKATGDNSYLEKAKSYVTQGQDPIYWVLSWENVNFETRLLLLEETGDAVHAQKLEENINNWINSVNKTSAGYRHLSEWGSMRYNSNASFVALAYSELINDEAKKTKYVEYAKSQMDYILGDNPTNFSYVVGYGENYPTKVHHRGATGFNDEHSSNDNLYPVEGALIGGFKSADDYDYQNNGDNRSDYYRNEVAVDYNAGFTGALAKLAGIYGEDIRPKTDTEIVAQDKNNLTFNTIKKQNGSESTISSDLNLISEGNAGSSISWNSSNNDVINSDGGVSQPTASQGNQVITLTATISKGSKSDTKTFIVTVVAEQDDTQSVALATDALTFDSIKNKNIAQNSIHSNLSLPTKGSEGTTITWSSDKPNSISNGGLVKRLNSDITVILTATITKGAVNQTKNFTLLVSKEALNSGFCQANYTIDNQWNTGAGISMSVSNQQGNLSNWEVTWTFPSGQTINGDLWNGVETQTEKYVSVLNESYNGNIANNDKIEFGFNLSHNGTNGIPTDIRLNGKLCDGQIGGVEKPEQPTNLEAELIDNTKVNLTWSDSSNNEDSFLIYKKVNNQEWELITLLPADTNSYEGIAVETDKSYIFKVEAKNIAGASASETVNVTPLRVTVQSGTDNRAIALVSNCTSCHIETNSNPSIPVIHGLGKDYLEKTLKGYSKSDHFGYAMPRVMEGYSSDEMEFMTTYFSNQIWIGNEITSYDIDTINSGKELYQTNCVACHGADGIQDDIMLSKQSEQYLIDTMTNYAKGLHKDADSGMNNMFKNSIGDDSSKIEALAKYLAVGLKVPTGTNDTIRGFSAKYISESNKILASWDFINSDTTRIDVLVNGQVVQTVNDLNTFSVLINNNGTDAFVIGQTYNITIKAISATKETLSTKIAVAVMTDEDYGKEHYNVNCKVCHGVNGTARADITKWDVNTHTFAQYTQSSNMPTSYYVNCDDECLDFIGVYVQNVLEPRTKDNNDSTVADVNSDIPRGYRLLNSVEYTNTLYSLFEINDDATRTTTLALDATELPKDNIVEGYNTDRDMNRINEDKVNALNAMAKRVETYLESLQGKTDDRCLINGYDFCIADKDEFLATFATKIFRRPLSTIELTTYKASEKVSQMVGDMLVSPKFLYRSEMGRKIDGSSDYLLTQYEIATAIAYSMSGTTPDDELLGLAESGALSNANTRVTQAVRLSSLQTGKDKLDDFIGRWLLEDNVYSLFDKNPERFVGYTNEVRTAQSTQILKYFRMVMESSSNSSYKDLFVNENMMTNKTLSDYYGEGMSNSDIFEKVPATDTRYGILTLGAIASKYANSEESHPFKRGKFVLARLMCHPLGLPGNGGDVPAIKDHTGENKRDRYAEHVNDPSCATCHNLMDPIGFTWEKYDGSGRHRTSEYHTQAEGGPKPIDTAVTLKGLLSFNESETYPANGMADVSNIIAQSDRGPECMALQYYRYISGDSNAEIENSLVVKKIASDFKNEQYDLQSLFTNMVKLNSFITRKGE